MICCIIIIELFGSFGIKNILNKVVQNWLNNFRKCISPLLNNFLRIHLIVHHYLPGMATTQLIIYSNVKEIPLFIIFSNVLKDKNFIFGGIRCSHDETATISDTTARLTTK